MALAKHHEEIVERKIANISAMTEARLGQVIQPAPVRQPLAGEVYLNRSSRRMEDVEVGEVGQTLNLELVSLPDADKPEVEIEDAKGRRLLSLDSKGKTKLTFKNPQTIQLLVSSGGYFKPYTIHIVEPFDAEQLPDFAKLVQSLAENPPKWSTQSFSTFRAKLEEVLRGGAVPDLFAQGILEYHLALFHEEQRNSSFRDRFHAAYGCLRWFIPYSDIARLICTYYLYCANEFKAGYGLCKGRTGRLRNSISFFLSHKPKPTAKDASAVKRRPGLPLLVALPDALTFQAIEAISEGRYHDALVLHAAAYRQIKPSFDRERAIRLDYLEGVAKQHVGDTAGARLVFESLLQSPWQPIAQAASRFLDT